VTRADFRRLLRAPLTWLRGLTVRTAVAIRGSLWLRPTLFSLVSLAIVGLIAWQGVPKGWLERLPAPEKDALRSLLSLVSGSALTISTVALSVVMIVLNMAGSQGSPRAVPELMADKTVQRALGTFVAVFVFGVSALLATGLQSLDRGRRALLFLLGIAAALLIIRWLVELITHVTNLLKLNRLIERLHDTTRQALDRYLEAGEGQPPATALVGSAPGDGLPVWPEGPGFVIDVDVPAVCDLALDQGVWIDLLVGPGDFASALEPLARVAGADEEGRATIERRLRAAIVMSGERDTTRDPRIGIEILAQVAAKALSPGINDPVTALDCLRHLGDIYAVAARLPPDRWPPRLYLEGRVRVARMAPADLLEAGLLPIARHGAGDLSVAGAVLETLQRLAALSDPAWHAAIADLARRSAAMADAALTTAFERDHIKTLESLVRSTAGMEPPPPRTACEPAGT
jgi:uncharacterized membrane protein